jgi:hypothetical protein
MTDKPTASNSTWVVEHILALFTLGSFAYLYWIMKIVEKVELDADFLRLQEQLQMYLQPQIALAGTLSVIAALVFWVRMFRDFFRQQPARFVAAWGAFLLIAGHFAALFYFWIVWRPRHRPP